MGAIELTCAVIVAAYVAMRLRAADADRGAVIVRLASLACAAWVGEDSVIRAYGFYSYAPGWSVFLDRVPLLIVCIWPIVIDSAHLLARRLVGPRLRARVALLGGAIVLADASLIEPIAVRAHLWTWTSGTMFDVPPIGIVGWAFFATAVMATLDAREARHASCGWDLAAVALAPLTTHAALVASWWALFRLGGAPIPPFAPAIVAWCASAPLALLGWRAGARVRISTVLARLPGAAFFFALLAVIARDDLPLTLYALAFAPPYLALVARSRGSARAAEHRPEASAPHA